ncbi:MAG TPA: lipid IV(A) 3-deoxy-D-manno-octulosonic acid transferase [Pseudomonadales bacterium]|nr:lipid IV(A) 3-deoxy-D-manno-octulosonic acid transferase [Pseudomonadales bacterium]
MPTPKRSPLAQALYTILLTLLLPLALLRLLWRSRADRDYRLRIGERLGRYALEPRTGMVWVHAVSVGELIAALPLIDTIRHERPALEVLVTTATPAASRLIAQRLGNAVLHIYAPWDLPWIVRRFLDHFRPCVAIVMETELWPNQVAACAARGIPLLVANARLSAWSAERYANFGAFARTMMASLTRVAAQTDADAARFRALGVPAANVVITGSMKWDAEPSAPARERAGALRARWSEGGERPVWIVASTHPGEDEFVLAGLGSLLSAHPRLLLVLVPRHVERAEAVAARARAAGFATVVGGSQAVTADAVVLVVDSVGELSLLYGAADLAFVGGSLVRRGGHNFAEPAAWGIPLLSGPSVYNFGEMSARLAAAGALKVVADGMVLTRVAGELLGDAPRRAKAGAAARAVVEANRGALDRLIAEVMAVLPPAPGR